MGRTGGVVCKDGGGLLVVGGHGGMVCGSACVMSVKVAALGRRGCPAGRAGQQWDAGRAREELQEEWRADWIGSGS